MRFVESLLIDWRLRTFLWPEECSIRTIKLRLPWKYDVLIIRFRELDRWKCKEEEKEKGKEEEKEEEVEVEEEEKVQIILKNTQNTKVSLK